MITVDVVLNVPLYPAPIKILEIRIESVSEKRLLEYRFSELQNLRADRTRYLFDRLRRRLSLREPIL